MLKSFAKYTLVAAAVAAALAAVHAQPYVTADGTQECDPQLVAKAPAVKMVPVSYTTEVLFAFNDDRLGAEALERLDELTQRLVALEIDTITAAGYADVIGSSHYNQLLSARRVWAVRDYLAARGITLERLHLEAKGDREPTVADACGFSNLEQDSKAKLIACLQPDRRVKLEVTGRIRQTD